MHPCSLYMVYQASGWRAVPAHRPQVSAACTRVSATQASGISTRMVHARLDMAASGIGGLNFVHTHWGQYHSAPKKLRPAVR